jgi:hypothetical protein
MVTIRHGLDHFWDNEDRYVFVTKETELERVQQGQYAPLIDHTKAKKPKT